MAKGRNPLSVGMKQNKEDFDKELKTYSTKALVYRSIAVYSLNDRER